MQITIYGLVGTGKSTIGKALAKQLDYNYYSTGNMMRDKALQLNLSIEDFDKLCLENPKFDIELDNKVKSIGEKEDNFIFDSRLAWYFIPNSFKVLLKCDQEIAFQRVAKRDEIEPSKARQNSEFRNQNVIDRYSLIYPQITYPPKDEFFDLIIDTTDKEIEQIINIILNKIDQKD